MSQHSPRIGIVLGTRPEFLKLAPIMTEMRRRDMDLQLEVILTSQHDEMLSGLGELFELDGFSQLAVDNTRPNLSGLTAGLIAALDNEFCRKKYDAILVQGDTTTALSAALTAFYHRIPLAHVEAGLRTRNLSQPFPEEMNRQLVARTARWHFAPTAEAQRNLEREGVSPANIEMTGNTIIDTLNAVRDCKIPIGYEGLLLPREAPELANALANVRAQGAKTLSLLTIHRRENHGARLDTFFRMVREMARDYPDHHMVYPYHLNPEVRHSALRLLAELPNLHLIAPLSYRPFVYLMSRVDFALSDSGGIQEEFPSFGKPLLVLRDVTERPEVVEAGLAMLVGVDPHVVRPAMVGLIECARAARSPGWFVAGPNPFGDGHAAERIVARIIRDIDASHRSDSRRD